MVRSPVLLLSQAQDFADHMQTPQIDLESVQVQWPNLPLYRHRRDIPHYLKTRSHFRALPAEVVDTLEPQGLYVSAQENVTALLYPAFAPSHRLSKRACINLAGAPNFVFYAVEVPVPDGATPFRASFAVADYADKNAAEQAALAYRDALIANVWPAERHPELAQLIRAQGRFMNRKNITGKMGVNLSHSKPSSSAEIGFLACWRTADNEVGREAYFVTAERSLTQAFVLACRKRDRMTHSPVETDAYYLRMLNRAYVRAVLPLLI